MLVNGLEVEENPIQSRNCIFQPVLKITSEQNDFVFVESNPDADPESMDDEERSLELLYREKKIYGTGLGVSVDWNIDPYGNGCIWSDFFPEAEVPQMNFNLPENNTITEKDLSMKYLSDLSDTSKSDKIAALQSLIDLYKHWVDDLEITAASLDDKYQSAATANITECKRAYRRMYSGLETLNDNNTAFSAFVLANRAMFMQRIHLKMQADTSDQDRYPDDDHIAQLLRDMDYRIKEDDDSFWRPFQLAFLLMDINSIVNDESQERDLVDLIWFPTGGGKTEAYLGLTAFTIFYRRLAYPKLSDGTTVIMRYTLRLLAAQQFTRAATLICACELIRRDCETKHPIYRVYQLGNKPITIGLWIGRKHIPNKNSSSSKSSPGALECLKELNDTDAKSLRYTKERYNKFQVLKCPWCGTKLVKDVKDGKLVGNWGYRMRDNKHFYLHCTQDECHFT